MLRAYVVQGSLTPRLRSYQALSPLELGRGSGRQTCTCISTCVSSRQAKARGFHWCDQWVHVLTAHMESSPLLSQWSAKSERLGNSDVVHLWEETNHGQSVFVILSTIAFYHFHLQNTFELIIEITDMILDFIAFPTYSAFCMLFLIL